MSTRKTTVPPNLISDNEDAEDEEVGQSHIIGNDKEGEWSGCTRQINSLFKIQQKIGQEQEKV